MIQRFLIGTFCLLILTAGMVNLSKFNTYNTNGEVQGVFEQNSENYSSNLSATEAKTLIEQNKSNPNFVVLDVRTLSEMEEGYIENSINLDFRNSEFEQKLDNLDKTKTYLVYCKTGFRSQKAVDLMKQKKFSQVYNITNGILDWKNQGFETQKARQLRFI
jgi:rhodanese-related sulfurtransferase